jgi:HEPN domain-containing protein
MTSAAGKSAGEWFRQADYDLDTAKYMFEGRRYFYAVFMCHLATEKALKGLYAGRLLAEPPRTHSLTYLIEKIDVEVPLETGKFLSVLSGLSVPTRYPDDLRRLAREFDRSRTERVLTGTKEALKWIRTQLPQ